jgi:hypothetical protein
MVNKGDEVLTKTLEGKVSLRSKSSGLEITVKDEGSVTTFLTIEMDPVSWSACLGNQANVPATLKISGLEKVGKKRLMDNISFEMDGNSSGDALELAKDYVPEGWELGTSTLTQNSLEHLGDYRYKATISIIKWVDQDDPESPDLEHCLCGGGQVALVRSPEGCNVRCTGCGIQGAIYWEDSDAILAWEDLVKRP